MPQFPFQYVGWAPPTPAPRRRRSCLVVPGSSPAMVEKAARAGADQVVVDLEDAVADDQKAGARRTVVAALSGVDFGQASVAVRVNAPDSPHQVHDLMAVCELAPDRLHTVVVPKVQSVGEVWFVEHLLGQLEAGHGNNVRRGIELQIETAAGMVRAPELVAVTDRTEALLFGPGDYAADLAVPAQPIGRADPRTPGYQWQPAMASLVVAARSVARDSIDGPYAAYGDLDGLRDAAWQARLVGMDGKWCIHPSQVAPVNEVFSPTDEEVDRAQEVLAAHAAAAARGEGAVGVGREMIDEASVRMARRLLSRVDTTS